MKKYYPLKLEEYLDHKMLVSDLGAVSVGNCGVMGFACCDERFGCGRKERYVKKIRFCMYGADDRYDNVVCRGQEIGFERNRFSSLAVIGFTEIGSYSETVRCLRPDGSHKDVSVHFYHMFENPEMLYELDYSERCNVAYKLKTNTYGMINYFISIADINDELTGIVLPDNDEIHISAITLIKQEAIS